MTRSSPLNVGQELPPVAFNSLTRAQLALFAGGSSDHNPMHIDIDFVRSAGMGDVFAHGMLVMALLGRAVTTWAPQSSLRSFSARFVALTQIGDALTARATVEAVADEIVDLNISIATADAALRLAGSAKIHIPVKEKT